jgi:hypothetical protein
MMAKLVTDAAKPGFMEVPAGQEKEFLKNRPILELSGIGKNRECSIKALGSFFKRSHKVIVALTVSEILDEHIAKKLA